MVLPEGLDLPHELALKWTEPPTPADEIHLYREDTGEVLATVTLAHPATDVWRVTGEPFRFVHCFAGRTNAMRWVEEHMKRRKREGR